MSSQLEVATPEFISVVAGAVIVMLGFGLIVPVMPTFAKRFGGIGDLEVGYILIGFAAMRLVGNIFVGRALRKMGERRTTVVGAIIVGLSSLAAAAAQSYLWLAIARVIGGVGSAFYFGGLLSFMLSRVAPDQRGRASSLFQGAVNAGILIGPAIGGLLGGTIGLEAPFVVYGVMCLIGAVWSHKTMTGEVGPSPFTGSRAGGMATLRKLLHDHTFVVSLASGFAGFVVMFGGIQLLMPSLWGELGMSERSSGVPFTLITGASVLVIFHAGSFIDRVGRRGPLILSAFGLSAGVLALGAWRNLWAALAAMVLVGVSTGYARPAATAILGDVSTEAERPAAIGGFRVSQDLGGLLGPAVAGVGSHFGGVRGGFFAMAGVAGLVALWTLTVRETAPHIRPGAEPEELPPPVIEPAG